LHWYTLKSVAPLNAEEGKTALTRMKQITTDSLASFTDRDDYFLLATQTPIDWPSFSAAMESSGFYIADVSRPSEHHEDYVKMGLAYQQVSYVLANWNDFVSLETMVISQSEFEAFDLEKQQFILASPNRFLIKN
jgi:hypothetical protein